jgi:hypothetical protein
LTTIFSLIAQAGIPRLAAETKKTLEEQINLAMYGVEAPISRLQTATGVKDKVAQYWIELLLKKSREIKVNNPGRTAESIKEELTLWLSQQPGDKVNPLLDISGLSIALKLSTTFRQSKPQV